MDERIAQMKRLEGEKKMSKVSMKGVIDMHVHTNPDLRLRAYDDFEMMEAGIRVGARAIVLKTHQGTTMDRAYLCNRHNETTVCRIWQVPTARWPITPATCSTTRTRTAQAASR